jgi:hypothetical protein
MITARMLDAIAGGGASEGGLRAAQLLRGTTSGRKVASRKAIAALESVEIVDLPESERSKLFSYLILEATTNFFFQLVSFATTISGQKLRKASTRRPSASRNASTYLATIALKSGLRNQIAVRIAETNSRLNHNIAMPILRQSSR